MEQKQKPQINAIMVFIRNLLSVDCRNQKSDIINQFRAHKNIRVCWVKGHGDLDRTSHVMQNMSTVESVSALFKKQQFHIFLSDYHNLSKIDTPVLGFGVIIVKNKRLYFAHSNLVTLYISDEIWKLFGYLVSRSKLLLFQTQVTNKNEEKKKKVILCLQPYVPDVIIAMIISHIELEIIVG